MKKIPQDQGPGSNNRARDIVRRGGSAQADADMAVEELALQVAGPGLTALVFFCSPAYNLDALGRAIRKRFDCPVIGCTTAGEIFAPLGYLENSLVGIGFASPDISLTPFFIPSLTDFVKGADPSAFAALPSVGANRHFALLLIDGLSMLEERVVAAIQRHLRGIPLIGGSAGDGLDFRQTHVYHDGRFHQNAAVLALFNTTLPFKTFRIQHFMPTGTKLVITEASIASRTIVEINGMPAAAEYARIVGLAVEDLSPRVFAAHPVMLRIGGEYFVRSIQKANADGSLTFYCAIDNGLVLTLAKAENLLDNLRRQLAEMAREMPNLQLVLGCDCILRRIELDQRNEFEKVREILVPYPFVGFSTYGEQYGGIHVNQTLTGLALGGLHE